MKMVRVRQRQYKYKIKKINDKHKSIGQEIRLICGQRENGAGEANAQDLRLEALQVIIGRRSIRPAKMKAKTITKMETKKI